MSSIYIAAFLEPVHTVTHINTQILIRINLYISDETNSFNLLTVWDFLSLKAFLITVN